MNHPEAPPPGLLPMAKFDEEFVTMQKKQKQRTPSAYFHSLISPDYLNAVSRFIVHSFSI